MLVLLKRTAYQPAPASTAAVFGNTKTGGSSDIWHFFPNRDKYVEGLKEMADVVGVDDVSIGTDQQVAPGSVRNLDLPRQPYSPVDRKCPRLTLRQASIE